MLRTVAILAVACALLLVLRVVYQDHGKTTPRQPLSTPDNSNYYMTDAVIYQMTQRGRLAYRTTATRILHFPNDSAQLTDIDVHYLVGTRTYWDVRAARGHIPSGTRDIYLYDGVVAHHPLPGGQAVKAMADHIWVRPNSHRIDSRALVRAIEPGATVEGKGMQANLNKDTLKLLNNVHVTYTP